MKPWTIVTAAGAVALLLIVANRRAQIAALVSDGTASLPDDASGIGAEQDQGGGLTESTFALFDITTYIPAMTDDTTAEENRAAFRWMLRVAEGTSGPDGYRTMFGYRYFDDFSDHPRQPAQFNDKASGKRLWTSAAGAYQFMAKSPIPGGGSTRVDTWDRLKRKLDLPDFSPASQDAACMELINECGALNDVDAGRFDVAVSKVRGVWASLPGAGYGQPERTLARLQSAYIDAGGTLA